MSKKAYETAIKLKQDHNNTKQTLDAYFEDQRKLKDEIKRNVEKQIKEKLTKLGEEEYTKSNTF